MYLDSRVLFLFYEERFAEISIVESISIPEDDVNS